MKKAILFALTAILLLSGCGQKPTQGETPDPTPTPVGETLKIGVGTSTVITPKDAAADAEGSAKVETSIAWVAVDAEGKIVYVKFDTAQNTGKFDAKGVITVAEAAASKRQKMDAYGMKSQSGIGKEWYEQIATLEDWMKGKTVAEVVAMELADGKVVSEDLKSGVTVSISELLAALSAANDALVEVKDVVSIGADSYTTVEGKDAGDKNGSITVVTNLALVALNSDNKIVYSYVDAIQSKPSFDATGVLAADPTASSKKLAGSDYNMVGNSGIGKEWFEQAAALEAWTVGKTVDEVIATPLTDGVATAEDLKAGVTIGIADLLKAVDNANKAVVTVK